MSSNSRYLKRNCAILLGGKCKKVSKMKMINIVNYNLPTITNSYLRIKCILVIIVIDEHDTLEMSPVIQEKSV